MTQVLLEPQSIEAALKRAAACLGAAGIEQGRRDARLLLAGILDVGSEAIIARPERRLSAQQCAAFGSLVARRAAREPAGGVELFHVADARGVRPVQRRSRTVGGRMGEGRAFLATVTLERMFQSAVGGNGLSHGTS